MGDTSYFLFDPIPSTFRTSIADTDTDTDTFMKYFYVSDFIEYFDSNIINNK